MRTIPGTTLIPTLNAGHSLGQLLHPEQVVEHVLAGLLRLPLLLSDLEPPAAGGHEDMRGQV